MREPDAIRHCGGFACIWYRRSKALFSRAGADVAMLLWEIQERGVSMTVLTWRI